MNNWELQILDCISSKDINGAKILLKQGFPINYSVKLRDENGLLQPGYSTLLLASIQSGLIELSEYLLESGINSNAKDSLGKFPLHIASELGDNTTIRLLVRYNADVSSRDAVGNTILHIAAINKRIETVKLIVEQLRFPVVVLNKLMQKPIECCKIIQENSKSLVESEELQAIVLYLWRKEEEFKKTDDSNARKFSLSPQAHHWKAGRTKVGPKEGWNVEIFPFKKQVTSIMPFKGRQSIQNYLKDKHDAIQKGNEEKLVKSPLVQYYSRATSQGVKLPFLKGTTI